MRMDMNRRVTRHLLMKRFFLLLDNRELTHECFTILLRSDVAHKLIAATRVMCSKPELSHRLRFTVHRVVQQRIRAIRLTLKIPATVTRLFRRLGHELFSKMSRVFRLTGFTIRITLTQVALGNVFIQLFRAVHGKVWKICE